MAALRTGVLVGLVALLLAACAVRDAPPVPAPSMPAVRALPEPAAEPMAAGSGVIALRCDEGLQLRLRVLHDEVQVEGLPGGPELLLRDAGGVTAQQSVFSNERVRAELGLGAQASEAVVHLLLPQPRDLHCRVG